MSQKEVSTIFPRGTTKTYGLMELVKTKTPIAEKGPEDTSFVWPNLVYIELISALIVGALLLGLSLLYDAPLEELANTATTPNPMKAPWYFLGLQELLVYFDPWLAGVVLPSLIIAGMIALPYVDINPKGSGYYSFSDRKFAVSVFIFGVALWYVLIVIGKYTRGMDWQWYWPWDDWSSHKPLGGILVDLELMLKNLFGLNEVIARIITYVLTGGYFAVWFAVPMVLFPKFYKSLGFIRYHIVILFLALMMSVPLKIYLRLLFSIKYVLITPWFKI